MLEPESSAAACEDEELAKLDEAKFREMHGADPMAVEKLDAGIKSFSEDQDKLEALLAELAEKEGLALH